MVTAQENSYWTATITHCPRAIRDETNTYRWKVAVLPDVRLRVGTTEEGAMKGYDAIRGALCEGVLQEAEYETFSRPRAGRRR